MFTSYLQNLRHSLSQNVWMALTTVLVLSLGIAASMTMFGVIHVLSGDPAPTFSDKLFQPHLDPVPKAARDDNGSIDPSANFTYSDAMALLSAHKARFQAAMSGGKVLVTPSLTDGRSNIQAYGRFATHEVFDLFRLSFLIGGGWQHADDDHHALVVVLSRQLANQLFGDYHRAVGKIFPLDKGQLRIIGVVDDWTPVPKFYSDRQEPAFGPGDQFYLPLETSIDLNLAATSTFSSWSNKTRTGAEQRRSGDTTWLQLWVDLPQPSDVDAYRRFLDGYQHEQKDLGRFEKTLQEGDLIAPLMAIIVDRHLVSGDTKYQMYSALALLLVCLVNAMALMLTRLLRKGRELAIRRALGASRRMIFLELSLEAFVIGGVSAVVSILLCVAGLSILRGGTEDYASQLTLSPTVIAMTVLLAILASVCAAIWPAWRAAKTHPASLLKS